MAAPSKPPPRSAERQALAEMIERERAAAARQTTTAAALENAERAVWAANAAFEAAEAAVTEAKEAATQHVLAVAAGDEGTPPRTIRQARDALQDAEDARDTARAVRDELRKRHAEGYNLDTYRWQVREAAARVLAAEWEDRAGVLVTEVVTTLPRLIETAELVRRLGDAGLFASARNSLRQLVGPVGACCKLSELALTDDAEAARARGAARFAVMMDALLADADAPLP
jgi:hypothetical protein